MKAKRTRWLVAFALIAYSVVLIRFVVFKAIPTIHIGHMRFRIAGPHTGPANFIPFKTILPQLMGQGNRLIDAVNLLGNIVPFMPIGLLAPIVFRSFSWKKAIALGVITGLSFEVMEVVFRVGIFDVDDILCNAFGVVLGYGVFAMFKDRAQSRLG
jgi:glycopeptide antibiotics resistance protein